MPNEANIDYLSIKIEADAEKASKAIANLTNNLNGLSLALNRINTNKISGFTKAIEGLSRTGKTIDDTTRTLEHMANVIADRYGIKSKAGIDAIKNGLNDLARASKEFQHNTNGSKDDSLWENIKNAESGIVDAIKTYSTFKSNVDDTTKSLREFISVSAKSGTKISLATVAKDLGDDLSHFQKVLGRNFTSTLDSTTKGVKDLEEWLGELDKEFGTGYSNMALDEAVRKLVESLESAKKSSISFEEALYQQRQIESDAKNVVKDYSDAILELVKVENSVQSSGISDLINSLKGLNDVNIPNFAPFAASIAVLNKVNIDTVVENLRKIKNALGDDAELSAEFKEQLNSIGNEGLDSLAETISHDINDSLREMTQNAIDAGNAVGKTIKDVPDVANNAAEAMNNLSQSFEDYNKALLANAENDEAFDDTIRILKEVNGEFVPLKTRASGVTIAMRTLADITKSVGSNFMKFAPVIESVTHKMGQLADIAIKGLKGLYSVSFKILKGFGGLLVDNFKEETAKVSEFFKKMRIDVSKQLTKMSAFWKRTMRTFTFMLVRKAITAVISNVKEAVDELALFEKKLGTLSNGKFNSSLSEIIADFHYIGRAIVAAFEPLINFVVPALNAVADAVANVLSLIGEFFAAFTGQDYFVKARKTVVDYGDSIDDNNKKLKEEKKLLLGIDELNVMPSDNDNSSSGKDSGVNFKDAFEEKPVSDKMKNLAEKIKGILADLFEPLKKAWDNAKDYLFNGFKYMTNELGKLGKSVWRDFITVWKQPETVKIFENLLRIIGDLEFVVGNLAKKFRQAWDAITDDGKTRGQSIFEGIRDNIGIVVQHLRNTTKYMKEWSNSLDFNPLLKGFDELLKKLKPLTDFLGGVFEDVMKNIVLEHIRYLIEEGLPHLMHTIGEVIDSFDFEKLRTQLQPIEKAFEKMRQNIHEGLVTAMGNIGKAIGEWTKTDNFQAFLDAIERFMGKITPERVEKLFTGLGMAILKIVEALADFVASPEFEKFIDDILAWFDSLTADDIANFFLGLVDGIKKLAEVVVDFVTSDEFKWLISTLIDWYKNTDAESIANGLWNIAKAIAAFKLTAFVGGAVIGFAKFLTACSTIKQMTNVGGILKGIGDGAKLAGGALKSAGEKALLGAGGFAQIAALAAGATADFVLIKQDIDRLKEASDTYAEAANTHQKEVQTAMDSLEKVYKEKGPEIATEWAKTVYDIDITGDSLEEAQGKVTEKIDTMWDDVPQNMWEGFKQGWDSYFGEDGSGIGQYASDAFTGLVDGIKDVLGIASPSKVLADIGLNVVEGFWNGINENWSKLITDVGGLISGFITSVVEGLSGFKDEAVKNFTSFKDSAISNTKEATQKAIDNAKELKDKALEKIKELPTNASKKFDELKKATSTKFTDVRDKIRDKMKESVDKVDEKLKNMKQKFEKFDLSRVATNIIRGFINGLRSAWVDVTKWANEAVANLKKKFQEGLKINSPSKVFEEYGEYVVQGFNEGISNFTKSTDATVDKWISEFSNVDVSISPTITPISPSGAIRYEGFADDETSTGLTKSDVSDVLTQFAEKYIVNKNNGDIKVTLEMNGRKLYEEIVRQDKSQLLRTGRSSFAY